MSTIVTRAGKGSPLTWNEVDNNFTNLNTDKLQSGNTAAALTITSATINGGTITGTALNGTLGATTPSTVAATTISASGAVTLTSAQPYISLVDSVWGAGTLIRSGVNTIGTAIGDFQLFNVPAGKGFAFSQNNATALAIIDASGNLGLGVTPSAWGNQGPAVQIAYGALSCPYFSPTNNQVILYNNAYQAQDTTFKYLLTTNKASAYVQGEGLHIWRTAAGGTAGNTITFTDAMTLDASGNLGIGTTTAPQINGKGIAIYDASFPRITMRNSTSGDGTSDGFQMVLNGLDVDIANQENGAMKFYTNGSNERMRLDSSGNLSLGFAGSPYNSAKMEIYRSSEGDALIITSPIGTGNKNAIAWSDSRGEVVSARIYNVDDGAYGASIAFANRTGVGTTTTERMRIDTSGNLLVGTTTNVTNGGLKLWRDYSRVGSSTIEIGHISGSASGDGFAVFQYSGTAIGTITQNGTTAVLYNTTSDYRLKTDVLPIVDALSTITALNPVSFTWVDGRPDDGFIAHELQTVLPNCVTGEKDAVNDDGTPKYQQMDNSGVVPFLVKAIQEQQAMIDELKAKVAALEAA
jgi:hypothetical protein